jgi:hypothetical protein
VQDQPEVDVVFVCGAAAAVVVVAAAVVVVAAAVVVVAAAVVVVAAAVVVGEAPVVVGEAPVVVGEAPVVVGEAPVVVGEAPVVVGEAPVVVVAALVVVVGEAPVVVVAALVVVVAGLAPLVNKGAVVEELVRGRAAATKGGLVPAPSCEVVVGGSAVEVVVVGVGDLSFLEPGDAGPPEYVMEKLAAIPATLSGLINAAFRAAPTRASPKLHTAPLLPASQ